MDFYKVFCYGFVGSLTQLEEKIMNTSTLCLVNEVFTLLGVGDFFALSRVYNQEDQKLMKSGEWDADNPTLITNKVKTILEKIDPHDLDEADRKWYFEILWFWYHHAVSYAIWRAKDRTLAQAYADKALILQAECQPPEYGQQNWLTKLLWFLVHDKVIEAKQWMAEMPADADDVERASGFDLISEYERGEFF